MGTMTKKGVEIKDASTAATNYKKGIDRLGASAWNEAMKCATPACAAATLKSKKSTKGVSLSDMKSNYKSAYS